MASASRLLLLRSGAASKRAATTSSSSSSPLAVVANAAARRSLAAATATTTASSSVRSSFARRASSSSSSSSFAPSSPPFGLRARAEASSASSGDDGGERRRRRRPLLFSAPPNPNRRRRSFSSVAASSSSDEIDPSLTSEREVMPYDALIVGGGPAGLSAAIKIRQLCEGRGEDLSVCVVEKGSEIGSHILSGNVFDPRALHELFPDKSDPQSDSHWTKELLESQDSHATPVSRDEFLALSETKSLSIPHFLLPAQLKNEGNYVLSLGKLCRYLGDLAEGMGVEVYPGFAASEILYDEDGTAVQGVATRDMGIGKDGKPKPNFERGVELRARQTLFAEGARGSCSESLVSKFDLRKGSRPQTYGLGIKEVWEVPTDRHEPGLVRHTIDWPLQSKFFDKTFGGTFLYHQEPNLILTGMVVGLDYANPYLNPYKEFQRWKTHPSIRDTFENGTCLSYGARVLNEGGYHCLPSRLYVPGGALLGCSAGFLNAVKIKGSHAAIKSGIVAGEATFDALVASSSSSSSGVEPVSSTGEIDSTERPVELASYQENMKKSWVYEELYQVRNCHEAFAKFGVGPGLIYTGFVTHATKGREPWTLEPSSNNKTDATSTEPADTHEPIRYPSPDGILTFDLLTNLQRSGVYHEDDQRCHLVVKTDWRDVPESVSMPIYAAPEQRFCPAGVYEYVDRDEEEDKGGGATTTTEGGEEVGEQGTKKKLVINSQNCVHCKCCSIKMPHEYIDWTVPEGGGGPQYQIM